jgi:hypothetical protein
VKICLGVVDVPYSQRLTAQEVRTKRWRMRLKPWQRVPGTTSTGDVAEILERRYGLFSMFSVFRGADIVKALEDHMQDRLDNLMLGQLGNKFGTEVVMLPDVDTAFQEFLDRRELDGRAPGVPTAAAERGVNHRLKHPYAKSNPPRPSFVDTGILQNSFRAWIDPT